MGMKTTALIGATMMVSAQAFSLTAKTTNYAHMLKSASTFEVVCEILSGSEVNIDPSVLPKVLVPVTVKTGSCAGKNGYIASELLSLNASSSPRLSRSTPILKAKDSLQYDCFALKNTPFTQISSGKNDMVLKIRLADGLCKGIEGWVSKESVEM